MNSQSGQRMVLRNAIAAMQEAGVDPKQAILSQSYLRLEVVAATNKTQYQFGVLVNDQPQGQQVRITENRLNLQDAFYTGTIQFMLGNTTNATDTNIHPVTYPNVRIFTTALAAAALYNVYNGELALTVNNRVITPSWDMMRHLEINQTQQNVTPLATTINEDQMNGAFSTSFPCEPNWVFIGSKNNVLNLNLPAAIGTLQATSTTVLILILRGVLAQNVTVVS